MNRHIEFFNIKGQDSVTLSSGCNSCSGGCEPVTHTITSTIKDFKERYATEATIERHELVSDNLDPIAERLQEVYKNSGEMLIITSSNVNYILSKLTPIIAIDGKLAANNYVPDADELKFALDHDNGIYSTICS
jgi:hypothetical protein